MLDFISSAVIVLALLVLFLTPVGVCLLLASPFWAMGMDIVLYFVDHQYPDKVIAAVSAVVAILFVGIVRFIWVVLLLQGAPTQDDEAVSAAHPVSVNTAGKYDSQLNEAPAGADLAAAVARSSPSANGSRLGHSNHEYRFPVVDSGRCWVSPESDVDSAGLLSNMPRMPEGQDAYAYHDRSACRNATLARDVCITAAVDKEFRGLPIPRADGVANASVHSPQVDSSHCSPSGVTAGSTTGPSDGAFVASAANVAGMMEAVDALSPVGGSLCAASAAEPLGKVVASAPATAACISAAADSGVAVAGSAIASGTLSVGASDICLASAGACVLGTTAAAFGNAMLLADSTPVVGGAVCGAASGVAVSGAFSFVSLVHPIVPSLFSGAIDGSVLGVKRAADEDFVLCAAQQQAKKQKVVPFGDGLFSVSNKMEDGSVAGVAGASGAAWAIAGSAPCTVFDTPLFAVHDDPMDCCMSSHEPLSPTAMDLDMPTAFVSPGMETTVDPVVVATDMDLDGESHGSLVWEPLATTENTTTAGDSSVLAAVPATTAVAPNPLSTAAIPATAAADATTATASTTYTAGRAIARPRGPSAHRRRRAAHIVVEQMQQADTTKKVNDAAPTNATTSSAGDSANAATATTSTTAANTNVSSAADATDDHVGNNATENKSPQQNNDDDDGRDNNIAPQAQHPDECYLDAAEILEVLRDYPGENYQFDEFEGSDFAEGLDFTDYFDNLD